jgi:hypothetical protein
MTNPEILILIIIPIVLALLPLIWGLTGWMIKRAQFLELIFRELEEIGPFPQRMDPEHPKKHWSEHHNNKRYLHKEILEKANENRDFILSLPSDTVYYVTQLWNFQDNSKQWLHMLSKLESKIPFWQKKRRREIAKVKRTWYVLMKEYGEVLNREDEENNLLN